MDGNWSYPQHDNKDSACEAFLETQSDLECGGQIQITDEYVACPSGQDCGARPYCSGCGAGYACIPPSPPGSTCQSLNGINLTAAQGGADVLNNATDLEFPALRSLDVQNATNDAIKIITGSEDEDLEYMTGDNLTRAFGYYGEDGICLPLKNDTSAAEFGTAVGMCWTPTLACPDPF